MKTSDIARLMEMFQVCLLYFVSGTSHRSICSQSSLLKYRDFEPFDDEDVHSDMTHVEDHQSQHDESLTRSKSFWRRVRSQKREKTADKGKRREHAQLREPSTTSNTPRRQSSHKAGGERPEKKVPVVFFDEAHKLRVISMVSFHHCGAYFLFLAPL